MINESLKKQKLCTTISPYLKVWIMEIAKKDPTFSSASDLVSVAIAEFKGRYELKKELEDQAST